MASYNFSKIAKKEDGLQPYNSMLQDNAKEMKIETKESDAKNINLKLKNKDKDNTIPYEKQLEANRTNKDGAEILEKTMDKSTYPSNKREMHTKKILVSPINVLSEEFDQKKVEAVKKAENRLKNDTAFWDKYVGEQMLGTATKVDANVSNSQLQNQPGRFSFNKETDVAKVVNTKISKMAQEILKDADALLFHVYSTAAVENRDLTIDEKAFVNRINKEKEYILAANFSTMDMVNDGDLQNSGVQLMEEDDEALLIRVENDGTAVVYENGQPIAEYNQSGNSIENLQMARDDYPEAEVENSNDYSQTGIGNQNV